MSARDPRWPELVAAYLEHNRDGAFGTTENAWVCAEHDALRHLEKGGPVSTIFEIQDDGSTLVKSVGEPVKRIVSKETPVTVKKRPRDVKAAIREADEAIEAKEEEAYAHERVRRRRVRDDREQGSLFS